MDEMVKADIGKSCISALLAVLKSADAPLVESLKKKILSPITGECTSKRSIGDYFT